MTVPESKERTLEVVLGELAEEIGKLQELLPAYLEDRRREGDAMTAKRVEHLFFEDDLRALGVTGLADDVRDAETSEAVEEILAGLQWFIDWADAG